MLEAIGLALYLTVAVAMGGWAIWCLQRIHMHPMLAVLTLGYGVVYGLVPLLIGLGPEPGDIFNNASVSALGAAGLFMGWQLTAGGKHRQTRQIPHRPATTASIPFIIACLATAALGFFIVAFTTAGSVDRYLGEARFAFRGRGGLLGNVIGPLMMRLVEVPVFLLALESSLRRRVVGGAIALAAATFAYVSSGGARSLALGLLGAVWVAWAIRSGRADDQSVERKERVALRRFVRAVVTCMILPLAGILLAGMYEARKSFQDNKVQAIGSSLRSAAEIDTFIRGEPFNYAIYLGEATKNFPEERDFLWLYPLRRLVFIAPGLSWLKPPDTNRIFGETIGAGPGVTVPPSLPGEGYVVLGGLLGVFPWLAMYGSLFGLMARAQSRRRILYLVLCAASVDQGLLMLRGQFYEVAFTLIAMYLVVGLLARLFEPWVVPMEGGAVVSTRFLPSRAHPQRR